MPKHRNKQSRPAQLRVPPGVNSPEDVQTEDAIPVGAPITATDAAVGEATDLTGADDTVIEDMEDDEVDHINAAEAEELAAAGCTCRFDLPQPFDPKCPVHGPESEKSADDAEVFTGFEEPVRRKIVNVDLDAQKKYDDDHKLVPVIPRKTLLRTRIGTEWWNFIKGQEQFVPAWVRDHLVEKSVV